MARLEPRTLLTLSVQFDYSYDSSNFFNTQAKKDALQAAATAVLGNLGDTLAAIQPSGGNQWSPSFPNPSSPGQIVTLNTDPTVPANTLVIYVGAAVLGGSEAGYGGPGGVSGASGDQNWFNTILARGKAANAFAPWGGSIAFDDSAATNWYFGTDPSGLQANQTDFFSVAEHELGHVLGIGTSSQWQGQISAGSFVGPAAEAAYGNQPVPVAPDNGHFAQTVTSAGQVAVMTPSLAGGTRRYFTPLDFAALQDLGWQPSAINPVVQLAQATTSVVANSGAATVTVTRLGSAVAGFTAPYTTADGTAHHGVDYAATSGTIHFAPGQTTATISVPLLNNSGQAGNLTFQVRLESPTGAALGSPATETITITPAPIPTTTSLTTSSWTVPAGQPVTLTATVAAASGQATPTGTVTFKDGANVLISVGLVNGVASVTTNALAAGTHVLTASYGGSASFGPSASGVGWGSLIATYAGNRTTGAGGDGGPATAASLSNPYGLAVDAAGDVFIADSANNRVRKVSPSGVITTVAGTGAAGYSGDGGPATSATLNFPVGVAVDAAGDLFIVDGNNDVVRKVAPTGIITTIAGTGTQGYTGDGGPATAATFGGLLGIAVDPAGDVFVTDFGNDVVRKIAAAGTITTVAGNGTAGHGGDGGPATSAQLGGPGEIALDAAGNLYIGEQYNYDVRKVSPSGVITTVAGTGSPGYTGDGGPATSAAFDFPYGLAVDGSGDLIVADVANQRLREISPSGTVSTFAGTGGFGYAGDGGLAGPATLDSPTDLAVDAKGDVFFIDSRNDIVREVSAGVLVNVTGGSTSVTLAAPATSIAGRFATLTATVPAGATGTVTFDAGQTVIGSAPVVGGVARLLTSALPAGFYALTAAYSGDGSNAPGTSAGSNIRVLYGTFTTLTSSSTSLTAGQSVTFTARVSIDPPGGTTPTGGTVTFTDGATTLGSATLVNGTATLTVSTLAAGAHSVVATYAGDGSNYAGSGSGVGPGSLVVSLTSILQDGYAGDGGPATSAKFHEPWAVAYDAAGNLYIADTGNSVIRKVSTSGVVTTIAGNGTAGYSGDGGPATSAELNEPEGLTVDAAGNVYVADTFNHRVRKITPAGVITTVAGTGVYGFSGDGGPATSAKIDQPKAVLFDASGDLLIGDVYGVRSVSPSGTITTIAGNGTLGDTGDGGPAASAAVEYISSLAFDRWGDLYLGSDVDSIVRMINPAGVITTVAGQFRKSASSGDGGPATSAQIDVVGGVAVDASGDLYITDVNTYDVRMVNPRGIITTVAGLPAPGHPGTGDGGAAASAGFGVPENLLFDASGNLIVADMGDDAVRRVAPGLLVKVTAAATPSTTALSLGAAPLYGRPVPLVAVVAASVPPTGTVTFKDGATTLGTAPVVNGVARFLAAPAALGPHSFTASYSGDANDLPSASGALNATVEYGTFTTLATSNASPSRGQSITLTATVAAAAPGSAVPTGGTVTFRDGATILGTAPLSSGVASLAVATLALGAHDLTASYSGDGSQFAPSASNVGPASLITTVVGTGQYGNTGDGGPARSARINGPVAVATDAAGDLYIADAGAYVIRKVNAAGVISTIAGTGQPGDSGDGGPATSAKIQGLQGIAVDAAGDVFFADIVDQVVREVTAAGTIRTVAGIAGQSGRTGDGGPAAAAKLNQPDGVAVDAAGDLFIAEYGNNDVREVGPTGLITTFAGSATGQGGYAGDGGLATSAKLAGPSGLGVDAYGDVFIADTFNNAIRMVAPSGLITTVAGNGTQGDTGDGGPATAAELNRPTAVTVDPSGDLFIDDYNNNDIREVSPAGVIVTLAGNDTIGSTGEGGPAGAAGLNEPGAMAFDAAGDVFLPEIGDSKVHEIAAGLPVVVGPPATSTTAAASASSTVFGQPVTLTAVVTATDGSAPTGPVTFKDGATVLGSGTLALVNGVDTATFTTSALGPGNHSITASYPSGPGYVGSTSPATAVSVGQDATQTTVAASPGSPVLGQSVTLTATVAVAAPGAGSPSGTVTFEDGSTVLGTGTLATVGGVTTATFTTAGLAPGAHAITAVYGGDADDLASTSAIASLTIGSDATRTTLAANPSSPATGQSVTLTATVAVASPGSGTPSGSVDFKDGTSDLGTVTLASVGGVMTATITVPSLAAGPHSFSAAYGGDSNDLGSSTTLNLNAGLASSTTTLAIAPGSTVFGQSATLTATVSAAGGAVPTGSVTFKDGATTLGTGSLSTSGGVTTATLATSALAVGSHAITAVYAGDGAVTGSTSAASTLTVGLDSTTTTIIPAPGFTYVGQPVSVSATVIVKAPGAATPGGTLTFKDGTTVLGSVPLVGANGVASAVFAATFTVAGTHSITAYYGGDADDAASTSNTVTYFIAAAASVSLAPSTTTPVRGQLVTLNAQVNHPPGGTSAPTGSVSFFDGTTFLGDVTLSPSAGVGIASLVTSTLGLGSHSIIAKYFGDANDGPATSNAVAVTVGPDATTSVAVAQSYAPVRGQMLTIYDAVAASAPGAGTPSGTVTFKGPGGAILGTAPLTTSGGKTFAQLTIGPLALGTETITAVYGGDSGDVGSTSSTTFTVGPDATAVTVVPKPASLVRGQAETVVALLAPQAPGAGTPTGTVTFQYNGVSLVTEPVLLLGTQAYAALAMPPLGPGSYTITAVYNGDAGDRPASGSGTFVVGPDATTTAAATSNATPARGQAITLVAAVSVNAPGAGTPTGVVTFRDGSKTLGTGTLTTIAGVQYATLTTASLAVGQHSITAVYGGDAGDLASTSAPFGVNVGPDATSTVAFASPSTARVGQQVVYYAVVTVTSPGAGTPTGVVSFTDNGTSIGGGYLGTVNGTTYTFLLMTYAKAGTHTITASYQGDAGDKVSISAPFTVTITAAGGLSGEPGPSGGLSAAPSLYAPAQASAIPAISAASTTLYPVSGPSSPGRPVATSEQKRAWLAALEALAGDGEDA